MNRTARSVLRKVGTDMSPEGERDSRLEREAEEARARMQEAQKPQDGEGLSSVPDEMLTESEKRHSQYRRRQAMGGKFSPAVERLPIMTTEERAARDKNRPKWRATAFEGPIQKLIEKYGDLEEVQRHLTLGQSMKYEFTEDGQILDTEGNLVYDGEKIVKPAAGK
jgi:hypothetical protein